MHPLPQHFRDFPKLRSHAIASALPFNLEAAPARFTTYERHPQEIEGFRFAEPAPLAIGRSKATKLNQPGLVRMKRQRKLLQPLAHSVQKAPGVHLVLNSNDDIIGIPHE